MSDRTTAIGVEIDAAPRASAVSWGAVLAGALIAIAVTLALLVFGSGLGLTLVSPWWEANADATTIGVSTIAFLVITQWASAGVGGYVAGRLRTRWSVSSDEVFFRDTAHGFLVWAVATVVVAGLATQTLTGLIGKGADIVGQAAGGAATGAAREATEMSDPTAYFVDSLYRPAAPAGAGQAEPSAAAAGGAQAPTAAPAPSVAVGPPSSPSTTESTSEGTPSRDALNQETARIIVRGMTSDTFPEADKTYLAERVAAETGMSPQEANARVDEVLQGLAKAKADAQAAAEKARKAAVTLAVVTFISLLVGAFIGAVAAALGGSHRDEFGDPLLTR